ncbi:hypothetical protein KIPE111705_19200 [Kibdelosporangium persicum]|uniref:TetR transcriptional regulator CgmR-like C-terminal domain-containing protein n=1 Tax=Kibdelosporangium persicum TaxID=2698649 RepID=A0ABX2FAE8_9PSEU|nr:hypothetical protein [Kibdelosporangium persicum]
MEELVWHMRERRRMYVSDDRFVTMVAFIDGVNCAGPPGRRLLDGFEEWLAGGPSPLAWSAQILQALGMTAMHSLTPDQEQAACAEALNLVERFAQTKANRG